MVGNVDNEEWYHGPAFHFLHDTDEVMDAFYSRCHLAGPVVCAFYAPSPMKIKKRLNTLLAKIKENPVIVPASGVDPEIPEVVTYTRVKQMISTALYQPVLMFARTAEVLNALEGGDGRPFYEYRLAGARPSSVCTMETVPPTVPIPLVEEGTADASSAILCVDTDPVTETVEEFQEYAKRLQEVSSVNWAIGALFRLSCVGRTVRPKWRHDTPTGGNTSFPILYVANAADNITPLISARANSARFPGSVVLVQKSFGHTSLSAASTCTANYIHNYFQTGTLPPAKHAVCEADVQPFEAATQQRRGDDSELSRAVHKLSQDARWGAMLKQPSL